jgi:hypothetical protein
MDEGSVCPPKSFVRLDLMSNSVNIRMLQVSRALDARPHVIDGKRVATTVGYWRLASQLTLRVRGLSPTTTDDMLYSHFSQYGKLVHWVAKRDGNNLPCDYGFISFSTKEEVL